MFYVHGSDEALKSFLSSSKLVPHTFRLKGEAASDIVTLPNAYFSIYIRRSDSHTVEQQLNAALEFLQENHTELEPLRNLADVTDKRLIIGIPPETPGLKRYFLHPELLTLSGSLGIGIEIAYWSRPGELFQPLALPCDVYSQPHSSHCRP